MVKPIESNPEVLGKYFAKLSNTDKYNFQDIFSLEEDWAFEMMPTPSIGVLLVYKLGVQIRDMEQIQAQGKDATLGLPVTDYCSKSIKFVKQYSDNACCTIALLHLLMNLGNCDCLKGATSEHHSSGWLDQMLLKNPDANAETLGRHIENDNALAELHEETSKQGVTSPIDDTANHFIIFLPINGHIIEFDGRKDAPIDHGKYEEDHFLRSCCRDVVKGRILKYVPAEDSQMLSCLQVSFKSED